MSILLSLKAVPSEKITNLGNRLAIKSGQLVFNSTADIISTNNNTITLKPDTAYKIIANSRKIYLNADTPSANKWGYEGHIQILITGTGVVETGENVVLMNALEPDAVNNCTVRFHNGLAIISVEDHVDGYIVVNGSTEGSGSLAYGISSSTNQYVGFDVSLNGTTIPLAGAVTNGEKHIVGNGREETFVSGAVSCTSATTFTAMTFEGSAVVNGALEFADGVYKVDTVTGSGTLALGSGVIVDLTDNANANPIAPNGGVTFYPGGATVKYGTASASSSYMLDHTPLSAGVKLTNAGVINLGGVLTGKCSGGMSGGTYISGRMTFQTTGATASSVTIGASTTFYISSGCMAQDCTVTSGGYCNARNGGVASAVIVDSSGRLQIESGGTANDAVINSGGSCAIMNGGIANEPVINSGGAFVVSSGGTALLVTSSTGAIIAVRDGGTITYK